MTNKALAVTLTALAKIVADRAKNKDMFAREGVNLTYTAYFVAACVAALKAFPIVNSSWTEQGILIHRQYNIGNGNILGRRRINRPNN